MVLSILGKVLPVVVCYMVGMVLPRSTPGMLFQRKCEGFEKGDQLDVFKKNETFCEIPYIRYLSTLG